MIFKTRSEVIVAFRRKEEQRIESALDEQTSRLRQALPILRLAEMEAGLHHACLPERPSGSQVPQPPLVARVHSL